MTFTEVTTNVFAYHQTGKRLDFQMLASGTIGGTLSGSLYITLPIQQAEAYRDFNFPLFPAQIDGVAAYGFIPEGYRDRIEVMQYDGGNLTSGSATVSVSGWYFTEEEGGFSRSQIEEDVRYLKGKIG